MSNTTDRPLDNNERLRLAANRLGFSIPEGAIIDGLEIRTKENTKQIPADSDEIHTYLGTSEQPNEKESQ